MPKMYLFNDMEPNKIFSRSITTFPGGPMDAAVEKAARRLDITPTQVILLQVREKKFFLKKLSFHPRYGFLLARALANNYWRSS